MAKTTTKTTAAMADTTAKNGATAIVMQSNAAAIAAAVAAAPAEAPPIFDQAVAFVLHDQIEGGYVNDPRDPGGETKFGISKRSYPREDIKNLTRDRAIEIYKRDFWDSNRCDELPPKLAIAMFDAAINQGAGAARPLLQRTLGVAADGIIGPVTLKAADQADQDEAVLEFLGWRLHRYAHTRNSATFMRGWANRILRLQRFLLIEFQGAS